MRRLNITFTIEDNIDEDTALGLLFKRKIVIGKDFVASIRHSNMSELSYPVSFRSLCLIVPTAPKMPLTLYFAKSLRALVWLAILVLIVYGVLVIRFVYLLRSRHPDTFDIFLGIFNSLLWQGPTRVMQLNGSVFDIFRAPFIVLGFILTNIILALAFRFENLHVRYEEIKTIDDFIRYPKTITGHPAHLKIIQNSEELEPGIKSELLKLFIVDNDYVNYAYSLNTTSAYTVNTNTWKIIQKTQENIKDKFLLNTGICFETVYSGLRTSVDTIIKQPLKHFIMQMMETGMYQKWGSALMELVQTGKLSKRYKDPIITKPQTLKMEDLKLAWLILLVGLALATICCVLECVYFMAKRHRLNLKK